jgi:hypothetical protein
MVTLHIIKFTPETSSYFVSFEASSILTGSTANPDSCIQCSSSSNSVTYATGEMRSQQRTKGTDVQTLAATQNVKHKRHHLEKQNKGESRITREKSQGEGKKWTQQKWKRESDDEGRVALFRLYGRSQTSRWEFCSFHGTITI